MNKEELIVELDNNYVQVNIDDVRISYCNTLDKELVKVIYNLQQENKQLKDNWNKLKEFINRNCIYDEDSISYYNLMNKIQELEDK